MPYSNVPKELWDDMDSCVEQVQAKQPELDKESAVAICYDSIVGKSDLYRCECLECNHTLTTSSHCADISCPECGGDMRRAERPGQGRACTLTMSLTKVQQMSDGRIRWRARANSGEIDSRNERCDISLFEDFAENFLHDQESLSRGEEINHPPTHLDIAHYSFYLPDSHRTRARVGWPIKIWTDGQALMMQGFFDETPLGQAAAKAVLADDDDRIKVSIGFYPDWNQSAAEDGVFTYRGGRGRARLDHLALTAHPVDLEARIVAGGKEMSSNKLTLEQDALDVLGDEELVDELETLRATAKSEVPEGAVVKDEADTDPDDTEQKGGDPEVEAEKSEEHEEEVIEESTEETEEEMSEVEPDLVAQMSDILRPFLVQLSESIGSRIDAIEQSTEAQSSELEEIKSQVQALAEEDSKKVKAALDSRDGDWLFQMLRNSAQHKSVVKGDDNGPDVEEAKDNEFSSLFGNPKK